MRIKKVLLIGGIFVAILFVFITISSMMRSVVKSTKSVPTNSSYGFSNTPSFSLSAPEMSDSSQSENDRIMPVEQPPDSGTTQVPQSERKIIKNGSLNIVVKNIEQVVQKISDDAVATGGYVSNSSFANSSRNQLSGSIRARIPADKLTDFIRSTKGLAVKVTSENITSRDVTAEYIDLDARIKNLEASELQYQDLMKKATNVTEVLTVQRELTSIRGQIEQLKGQLQYLQGNAEMSQLTIYIALDEAELPIQETDKWRPEHVFKMALSELTLLGKNLSYIAIFLAVFAVVWVPIGAGMWFLYKFLRRKIK